MYIFSGFPTWIIGVEEAERLITNIFENFAVHEFLAFTDSDMLRATLFTLSNIGCSSRYNAPMSKRPGAGLVITMSRHSTDWFGGIRADRGNQSG